MTLPASRNTTYAAQSQLKSADMNAIQDQIIALRGQRTLMLSPDAGHAPDDTAWTFNSVDGGFWSVATPDGKIDIPIPLHAGERIVGWSVYGYTAGATTFTASLWTRNCASGVTTDAAATSGSGSGYKQAGNAAANVTPAADVVAYIHAEFPTAGDRIYGVKVVIDWP